MIRLGCVAASILLLLFAARGQAQAPNEQPSLRGGQVVPDGPDLDRTAPLAVVSDLGSDPLLLVDYPWAIHEGASVEVRALPETEVDPSEIRPLGFAKDYLRGELATWVYRCHDQGADAPLSRTRSQNGYDFEIFAGRNHLGKPAACVAYVIEHERKKELVPAAAFCELSDWAVNEHLLYLTLPRKYFARPARLRVWMLRGNDQVWSKTVSWPGYPKGVAVEEEK